MKISFSNKFARGSKQNMSITSSIAFICNWYGLEGELINAIALLREIQKNPWLANIWFLSVLLNHESSASGEVLIFCLIKNFHNINQISFAFNIRTLQNGAKKPRISMGLFCLKTEYLYHSHLEEFCDFITWANIWHLLCENAPYIQTLTKRVFVLRKSIRQFHANHAFKFVTFCIESC